MGLQVNSTDTQCVQGKGSIGYDLEGSPTISNGIATGFSGSNCLKTTAPLGSNNFLSLKIKIKCKTGASLNENGPLLFCSGNPYWLAIRYQSGRIQFLWRLSDNQSYCELKPNATITANTDYIIVIDCTPNSQKAAIYDSNNNLLASDISSSTIWMNPELLNETFFGSSGSSSWDGSIDFNETKIELNGKTWFYQPQPCEYVVKDGKLVFADPKIYLSGTNNYSVVGSPTITDGVAIGFSSANYLQLPAWQDTGKSIDLSIAFIIPTDAPSAARPLNQFGVTSNDTILNIPANKSGVIARLNSTYSLTASYDLQAETLYVASLTRENASDIYALSIYNASGSLLASNTLEATGVLLGGGSSRQMKLGYDASVWGTAFYGSIDLKRTYLKDDGYLWFYGKNYAGQNIAPVPSGFTYGTTTTPSIGFVDMRTQAFAAAPSGATIGQDA